MHLQLAAFDAIGAIVLLSPAQPATSWLAAEAQHLPLQPPVSLQSAAAKRSWWHRTYSGRYDERRYFAQWEGNLNKTIAWNKRPDITYWQSLAVDDFR